MVQEEEQSEELSEYSGHNEMGVHNDMEGDDIGMGDTSQLSATQTTPGGGTSNKRSRGGVHGLDEEEDMDNITEQRTENLRDFMEQAQPGAMGS